MKSAINFKLDSVTVCVQVVKLHRRFDSDVTSCILCNLTSSVQQLNSGVQCYGVLLEVAKFGANVPVQKPNLCSLAVSGNVRSNGTRCCTEELGGWINCCLVKK